MTLTEEEAKAKARNIVDQFDMSLRDHGSAGYRHLERLIQGALVEASLPKATDTLAIAQQLLSEALTNAKDESRYFQDLNIKLEAAIVSKNEALERIRVERNALCDSVEQLLGVIGHAQDHIASGSGPKP